MRTALTALLFASALLTAACAPAGESDSRSSDAAAIRALDEQWSATAAKNDVEGAVAFYADDAVLLAPNAPIAKDRNAIRNSWAAMLGPNTAVSWQVSKAEVARSGDLGYLYGAYQLSVKDPNGGPGVNDRGKMVEVWKKQSNGKWKCIVDTFNSDIPLPQPAGK